jgi:predicted nucleotidyltransferase
MARKSISPLTKPLNGDESYRVPSSVIRRYARQIAERFDPNKIILFGSYAYGQPRADSDVDLLVIMPAADEMNQSVRIRLALEAPFPLDLLVRTPQKLERRIKDGDWFLREIMAKGEVLYEKRDVAVGSQSRGRHSRSAGSRQNQTTAP